MKNISPSYRFCLGLVFALIFFLGSPGYIEASQEEAVFAGGCFWCLEHDLEGLPGVISVDSGYTGGKSSDPTYRNHQGHKEAVILYFDPEKLNYQKLLRTFWRNIDPLDGDGQFCDRGDSYRPMIFTKDDEQRNYARQSVEDASKELDVSIKQIKVKIQEASPFWLAEQYHQDFAKRNRLKYKFYRNSCGRDKRLDEVWGRNARTDAQWHTN